MANLQEILRSKIMLIFYQFVFLISWIYILGHEFSINFDEGTDPLQQGVIQFIANFIFFEGLMDLIVIYNAWTIASLIVIFTMKNIRKSLFTNLTLFGFLSFFFYVFVIRHSPEYYGIYSQGLITASVFLGIYLSGLSIVTSLLISIFFSPQKVEFKKFDQIDYKENYLCPHCGTKFSSLPLYCHNCLKKIN